MLSNEHIKIVQSWGQLEREHAMQIIVTRDERAALVAVDVAMQTLRQKAAESRRAQADFEAISINLVAKTKDKKMIEYVRTILARVPIELRTLEWSVILGKKENK